MEVRVTASNASYAGGASASATSQPTPIVDAEPPADLSVPVISGLAEDGQTLTASTGTWTGTAPLSYSYQWQSCTGSTCSAFANVAGDTSSTLTPGNANLQ